MLPRWHVLLGILFAGGLWFFAPEIKFYNILLLFLASVLIDFDHYAVSVFKTGKISLKDSFVYHKDMQKIEEKEYKKGIKRKGDFHLFHTIEFHILIGVIGIFFSPFFYIFIGMVFHSLTDVFSLISGDRFYRREFFFFKWLSDRF